MSFLSNDNRYFFSGITQSKDDLLLALRYYLSICHGVNNLIGVPMVGVRLFHDDAGNKQSKAFRVDIKYGCWVDLVDLNDNAPEIKKKELHVQYHTDEPFLGLTFGYLYKKMAATGDALKHFDFDGEFSIVCLTQTQKPKITVKEEIPYEYIDEL